MSQKKLKLPSWKARKERGLTYFYYRTRIFLISLGLAVFMSAFSPHGFELSVFLGCFMTFVTLGDILVYRVLKRKESDQVSAEELMRWDGMTPLQFDTFIAKMVKLRLNTFLLGLMGFVMSGFHLNYVAFLVLGVFCVRLFKVISWIHKKMRLPLSYATFLYTLGTSKSSTFRGSRMEPVVMTRYTCDWIRYGTTGIMTTTITKH